MRCTRPIRPLAVVLAFAAGCGGTPDHEIVSAAGDTTSSLSTARRPVGEFQFVEPPEEIAVGNDEAVRIHVARGGLIQLTSPTSEACAIGDRTGQLPDLQWMVSALNEGGCRIDAMQESSAAHSAAGPQILDIKIILPGESDLRIDEAGLNPGDCRTSGEMVSAFVTIRNDGNAPSEADPPATVTVAPLGAAEMEGTADLPPIESRSSKTVAVSVPCPTPSACRALLEDGATQWKITLLNGDGGELDSRLRSVEWPEVLCPPADVDLVVRTVDVNVVCGADGCVSTVTATVVNVGEEELDQPVTIEWLPPDGQSERRDLEELPPERDQPFVVGTFRGNCYSPDCSVEVTVDPDHDIAETDESNNTLTFFDVG